MPTYPPKPAFAVLVLTLVAALGHLHPRLAWLRIADFRAAASILDFTPRRTGLTPTEDELKPLPPALTPAARARTAQITDPTGAMAPFYDALWDTEQRRPNAVTRILHYGESPTTADLITADIRALLQHQFGDAGHGFVFPAKPWAWYQHRGLEIRAAGWKIHPAHQGDLKDGLFGLGGVTFLGGPGASSRITVRDRSHTIIEVSYLAQPKGGSFTLLGDGSPIGVVQTHAETAQPGFATYSVAPGIAEYSIDRVSGDVRLFGIGLAKARPGVIYDSLGLNGASIVVPARQFNENHWALQLQHAAPQLVILNYGINESVFAAFVNASLARELRLAIARLRQALPGTPVLIMSPMDRGERRSGGEIATPAALERVVAIQGQVAAETGCAFFNTFAAMGGAGTMGKWYNGRPRLVGADLIHPMPAGARKVGELFYRALLDGYFNYKLQRLRARFAKMGSKSAER